MEDIRVVTKGQFVNIIKRRLYTVKKELNSRIEDRSFPKHNDILIKELNMLRTIAKLHGVRRP